jgi:hypothetical protein
MAISFSHSEVAVYRLICCMKQGKTPILHPPLSSRRAGGIKKSSQNPQPKTQHLKPET